MHMFTFIMGMIWFHTIEGPNNQPALLQIYTAVGSWGSFLVSIFLCDMLWWKQNQIQHILQITFSISRPQHARNKPAVTIYILILICSTIFFLAYFVSEAEQNFFGLLSYSEGHPDFLNYFFSGVSVVTYLYVSSIGLISQWFALFFGVMLRQLGSEFTANLEYRTGPDVFIPAVRS